MKRLITKRQEQVYRLRHHNFAGLTTKRVAAILGVTTRTITRYLQEMKEIAPQLFPILTKRQANAYHLFVCVGLEQQTIADSLGTAKSTIGVLIHRIRAKGTFVPRRRQQLLYVPELHDYKIKQKF